MRDTTLKRVNQVKECMYIILFTLDDSIVEAVLRGARASLGPDVQPEAVERICSVLEYEAPGVDDEALFDCLNCMSESLRDVLSDFECDDES